MLSNRPKAPAFNSFHITKRNIPVQHGISGLNASSRSCDRCGTFHPVASLVSGASVKKNFFKVLCPDCAAPRKQKEEQKEGDNVSTT
jgi:hypothetical protein